MGEDTLPSPLRADFRCLLAWAPVFGMPPPLSPNLGLAYLNGALREAGFAPQTRDWVAHTLRTDPHLHADLFARAMPEAGGYYGVDLPLLLDAIAPGSWPVHGDLGRRIALAATEWAAEERPRIAFLHIVDANLYASSAFGAALRAGGAAVVMGGPSLSRPAVRELLLRIGACDVAVVGEGERAAVELCKRAEAGLPLRDLPGTSWLTEHGELAEQAAPGLASIHELPLPSFEGMPLYGAIPMLASRGCIRDCSFCSEKALWPTWRLRRVEDVVAELKGHLQSTGLRRVFFHDDLLNGNPRWLTRLCGELETLEVQWECYLEPVRIEPELARALARGGLRYARMGVEHLSPPMLDLMNRKGGLQDVRAALDALCGAGINVFFDLVVGHPQESEAAHQECMAELEALLSRHPRAGVSVNPFSLLDSAPVGHDPARYGVVVERYAASQLPEAWLHLADIAPRFIRSHTQSPDRVTVLRRAGELRDVATRCGRRHNLTDREEPRRALRSAAERPAGALTQRESSG
jgi:radical SAM superfamily enzyme YgiQ (UPF0313 family)